MDGQQIRSLLSDAATLVAAGFLTQAEAEGAIIAALNVFAPKDTEASNERKLAALSPEVQAQMESMAGELEQARASRLDRAREVLLAVSDEAWEAAGGALDG